MYQYTLNICCLDLPESHVEAVRSVSPLPAFKHSFFESMPKNPKTRIDLLLLGKVPGMEELEIILPLMKKNGEIILLPPEGSIIPDRELPPVYDIWKGPLSRSEIKLHFSRLLKEIKTRFDLLETRQYLDVMMDTSPNLTWIKSRDGIHELVNSSFCRAVKKCKGDIQGKRHAYIWDVDEDDPACIETERVVMESGKTHIAEETITTREGKRLLKTYKSPLRDINGEMMGTLGIAVDITRERHYHNQAIASSDAIENLFTTMDCGILCHSLDGGKIISVNRAALKLLGFTTEEELASNFDMVSNTVAEEDKRKVRAAIRQLRNNGDSSNFEYRVVHPDGEIIHVMGNAKIVEKNGELVCQRFMLDCTAQKVAEEKRQNEKERRQLELVRALSVDYQLVYVLNPVNGEGTILQLMDYPDKKLKRIFSSTRELESKIETYVERCVHPEDRATLLKALSLPALKEELALKNIFYLHYRTLDDDKIRYFQLKAVRAGSSEDPYRIIIGIQSVDSQTRYEMEQKNRLREALRQAKKASTAKTIFLSNMSHDIRTPMNAVVGYTSLALAQLQGTSREKNSPQVEEYLKKILTSGNHLISLINNILDMSHIESGKIQLDEKLYNLPEMVTELWNIVKPSAEAKNQNLALEMIDIHETNVFCDKLRVNQVLLNLLSNCIKYTPQGGSITMKIREIPGNETNSAKYEFLISDNGIGMTEEFLTRIFDPFERAQTSTIAGIEGTGLGMTITRNIVNMMNGSITVESELNVGTQFNFTVSFRLPEGHEENLEQGINLKLDNIASGESCDSTKLSDDTNEPIHILLAEDNEMNQEIAAEFLSSAGYSIDIASNGEEAVNMLKASDPGYYSVVLMDVQMPVMDGYLATERIRKLENPAHARIPIIAMTANSFEEDRQRAMAKGMNGHIAKPIDFKILFGTLDKLFEKKGSRFGQFIDC